MINDIIIIDLAPFGGEGAVEIAKPSFRKKQIMKNELGRCMGAYVDAEGTGRVRETPLGDIEVIKAMSYIKSAPFPQNLNGFMDFCDKLESKGGSADDLFDEIQAKIAVLEKKPGPLDGSVSAETEN